MSNLEKPKPTYVAIGLNKNIGISKKPFYFTAILYMVAAVCVSGWIYLLIQNFDQVKRWATLPVIGWLMVAMYVAMTISIPVLFTIGIKLFLLIKNSTQILVTDADKKQRRMLNMLLIVGITVDVLVSSFMIFNNIEDKSLIPFAVAFFGGRVLQANFEAINFYFSFKK